jgi:hypothetical protein
MAIDRKRLLRLVPLVVAVVLLVAGWMLFVQPRFSASTRADHDIDALRQRLTSLRAEVAEPMPPAPATDPATAFERVTAAGDATSLLLEELARLAAAAPAANLLIETGERVDGAARAAGPQASNAPTPDPRIALFATNLSYTPVTMSFDAAYSRVGEMLWGMRDLATTVELRNVEVRPADDGRVHVAITLFAYARPETGGAVEAQP